MVVKRQHRRNYNIAGHSHELTFSCYKRYPFLKSDRTCTWLADSINQARVELEFDLWAYVFMPDHVHLIIYARRPMYDIAKIRAAIKHPTSIVALDWLRRNYPGWIARLTRKRGSRTETLFWQSGGGYDRNIDSSSALLQMIDYLHMNPVRKGLVARAEDWKWSSARQHFGKGSSLLLVDQIPTHCLDR